MSDTDHVAFGKVDLFCDIRGVVAAGFEAVDFAHQFQRRMRTPREVFYQAHQIALFSSRFDNDRRNLGLPERNVCFKPALAAGQIVRLTFL